MTSEACGYQDTANYTYLNDRYTVNTHISYNGSLVLISNDIFYQHLKNHTDSIVSTSTGYGVQAGNYSSSEIYFYYNQANQDSLEKTFFRTMVRLLSLNPQLFLHGRQPGFDS